MFGILSLITLAQITVFLLALFGKIKFEKNFSIASFNITFNASKENPFYFDIQRLRTRKR